MTKKEIVKLAIEKIQDYNHLIIELAEDDLDDGYSKKDRKLVLREIERRLAIAEK